MTHFTDRWVIPGLTFLGEWSLRWGVVIAIVVLGFATLRPKRASVRYLICLVTLCVGVLLPFTPRWGNATLPWPSATRRIVEEPPLAMPESVVLQENVPAPIHRQELAENPQPSMPVEPIVTQPATSPVAPPLIVNPLTIAQRAALIAAFMWATVTFTLVFRLACGRCLLGRLRRGVVQLGADSDALLEECRVAIGLRRSVSLAVHKSVVSPVVMGGVRPLVLVPADWESWSEPSRRACLLHELSHLARWDDWSKLVEELLRAVLFFHPLIRWLLNRLEREREILCDEAAVSLGSEPIAYARLLLDLARRPGRLLPVTPLSRHGWLPFLERQTVEVRIERLLEKDMLTNLSRLSAWRSVTLGFITMIAALAVGGLRVQSVAADDASKTSKPVVTDAKNQPAAPKPAATPLPAKPVPVQSRELPKALAGNVLDPDKKPIPGAKVVIGTFESNTESKPNHQTITADAQGHYEWPVPEGTDQVCLIAYKPGYSAGVLSGWARGWVNPLKTDLKLEKREPFAAILVDEANKPLAGAKMRVQVLAGGSSSEHSTTVCFTRLPEVVVQGSPVENLFSATTGDDGSFSFANLPPKMGFMLDVVDASGKKLRIKRRLGGADILTRHMETSGFVTPIPGELSRRVIALPAARISGRVTTKLPGVSVAGLDVTFQVSRAGGDLIRFAESPIAPKTDAQGRFEIDGLDDGRLNVFVFGKDKEPTWTYKAANDVTLTSGKTADVDIELMRGVEVEGTVVIAGTNTPIPNTMIGMQGPNRPRSGAMVSSATSDEKGRYRFRLPVGETYFYVMRSADGFTTTDGHQGGRTVTIPEGVTNFEGPAIELAPARTVRGKVVDMKGSPIAGAKVSAVEKGGYRSTLAEPATTTDNFGEFKLPPGMYSTVVSGKPARLQIQLKNGISHEATTVPGDGGVVLVKLAVSEEAPKGVAAPDQVGPDEIAGVVVDSDGKPIEGAEVDVWTWYPGHEAKTDAKGFFRIGKLEADNYKVEVIVRKPGYTPRFFLAQPTATPGWVITLGNKTYIEGNVTGPDGKPVAGALIRANYGPKQADRFRLSEIWADTTSGADGRYKLWTQSDIYDIQVRVPGTGSARLQDVGLNQDEAKHLDIKLTRNIDFKAIAVDSITGKPVPGVRLWNRHHKGVEGRSDVNGVLLISDMPAGKHNFQVEADGYSRWWSQQAVSEWNRFYIDESKGGWQRNFDALDFEIQRQMEPVTIILERGVTITGRVVDPDGKPVANATVAPARTGSGNSLAGDSRFSAPTNAEGKFTMHLPASGAHGYNLTAHDGKYDEWRTWANGVLPPIRTKPGETLNNVELRLTKPATVRGRVVDANGKPIANRDVRACAFDLLENRYYDPTVKTKADGTYELKFIRAGEQYIQVAPFWGNASDAPFDSTQTIKLSAGDVKDGVDFKIATTR